MAQTDIDQLHTAVTAALARVQDPEIRRPITELGMLDGLAVAPDGTVSVRVLLTVAGCPMREKLSTDVTAAVSAVPGVTGVDVDLASGRLTVTSDAPVDGDAVHAAVDEAGYELAGTA